MTKIPVVTTGGLLKAWRKKTGLSQERLADAGGVGRTQISDYEADRYSPSVSTILKLIGVIESVYGPLGTEDHLRLARFFRGPRGRRVATGDPPR